MDQRTSPPTRRTRPRDRSRALLAALILAPFLGADAADAQREPERKKAEVPLERRGPDVWALTGARIVVAPGRVVEDGTLVIADGKIRAAGAAVETPAGAREVPLEGKTLFPGFIDSYLPRSWPKEKLPPQGGSATPRVHPERDLSFHAFDGAIAKTHRRAGFTTALVVPADGVIRGQSALVNLGDGGLGKNLLRGRVAQHFRLEGTRERIYGRSLMGAMALVRQTLLDAGHYGRIRHRAEGRRLAFDRSLEALAAALASHQPSVFETEKLLDAGRAARLAEEFELDLWLVGNGHEYKRLAQVVATGAPILLPLDFLEPPEVGDEGDDLSVKLEDLRHWDRAPENPIALLDAGVTFAITPFRQSSPRELFEDLAAARERGMTEDQLLAALTTIPARLLGLEPSAGTLEAGKMANLLVVDGELWTEKPKILDVWIDGRRYPQRSAKAPAMDPTGEWRLTLRLGDEGEPPEILLRLAGTPEELAGQVEAGNFVLDLSSALLSGSTLEVVYDGARIGAPGSVTLELELEGDRARGKGLGPSGEFEVEGRRVPDRAEGAP